MLSKTTQYALRAIVYLGREPGKHLSIKELAKTTQTPQSYLSKVMQILIANEVVTSQRGLGGGVCLKTPPDKLTLWDVVEVFECPLHRQTCPLGLTQDCHLLCPLFHELDRAQKEYKKILKQKTISSLSKVSSCLWEEQ